jgi:cell division protein FtsB
MKLMASEKYANNLPGKLTGPLMLALAICYLAFHALSGEHGIYALLKEERKLEILRVELNDAAAKRRELEHRVRLMSSGSLDLDMLDEQARALLDEAREDEVVIPVKK